MCTPFRRFPALFAAVTIAAATCWFTPASGAAQGVNRPQPRGSTSISVRKVLVPANDPGRFDLQIDGATAGTGGHVGDGGTTGSVTVSAGTHTVSEAGAAGTFLAGYTTTISGDCAANGVVVVASGESKRCTITNVRKPRLPGLAVRKVISPPGDPGRFNLLIDGLTAGSGANVGNGGTTGFVMVSVGTHSVGETAAAGTDLSNYTASFSADCPGGNITLAVGVNATCTITNTRKLLQGVSHVDPNARVEHGTWTQGPGTASFTICAYGTPCNINGPPGAHIPVTMEVWGAGGGGGSGMQSGTTNGTGGNGAGGGGGGGYAKYPVTLTIPANGVLSYYVKAGSGGGGGALNWNDGGDGEPSEVRLTSASGGIVLRATGGGGGWAGNPDHFEVGTGRTSEGGAGGTGTVNGWTGGTAGDGTVVTGCNGGAGSLGGAGAGPGRTGPGYYNDGGDGGHGGYYHHLALPTCTDKSNNNGLEAGKPGGNGLVKITW